MRFAYKSSKVPLFDAWLFKARHSLFPTKGEAEDFFVADLDTNNASLEKRIRDIRGLLPPNERPGPISFLPTK